jgi:hypothetical protein
MSGSAVLARQSLTRYFRSESIGVARARVYAAPDGACYLAHETKAGLFVARPGAEKGPLVFKELPVHPRLRANIATDMSRNSAGFYVVLVDRFTMMASMLESGLKIAAETDLESAEVERGSHSIRQLILSVASRLYRSVDRDDRAAAHMILDFSEDAELRRHYQKQRPPFAAKSDPLDVQDDFEAPPRRSLKPGVTFEDLQTALLDGPSHYIVNQAIEDLAKLGDPRGVELLNRIITDPTHRRAAAQALGILYRKFS